MKKIIAVLLSLIMAITMGMPAFATDAEAEAPQVTDEEILDAITTEEFKENLEEDGIDVEEFEENIENGDYVIVEDEEDLREVLTDEEIEAIRKETALSPIYEVNANAFTGLVGLVMLPFVPVMIIVPLFGWVTSSVALASPLLIVSLPFQYIAACIEAISLYVNFDDSVYRTQVEIFGF